MTVTLSRSWRSRSNCFNAPSVATLPASETVTCSGLPASNSGIGSFHRCFCNGKRLGRPSHGRRTAALSTASRRPETPASAGDGEVCYIMFTAPQ